MRAAGGTVAVLSLWSGERRDSRADDEFVAALAALTALRLRPPSAR
jgi:hypothetical protein